MPKPKKQCFVLEIPLKTDQKSEAVLRRRFNVAHHIYNCFLGESEKRRKKFIADPDYISAVALLKTNGDKEQMQSLFEAAKTRSGYYLRDASQHGKTNGLETFAADTISNQWLSEHIDSHTRNKLMERAFAATQRKTKGKKIKFKRFGRDHIYSLEGKTNKSPIRWVFGEDWKSDRLVWSGLSLEPIFETKNGELSEKHSVLIARDLAVSYARIVRTQIKGQWRYKAQLICAGLPKQKNKHVLGEGTIGLDLGVSTYALVGDDYAELGLLAGDASKQYISVQKQKRILQRRIDRKRRLSNPDNFNPNGTIKKGRKKWITSKSQRRDEIKFAELSRVESVIRKCMHGKLTNKIRSKSDIAKFEKLSYKGWQKNFGKSIGKAAPGMFISMLKNKFSSTGGRVVEIDAYKAKLTSGGCPMCGRPSKKALWERIHKCECGYEMQRDLTSALLAKTVDEKTHTVDAKSAKKLAWESRSLLRTAIKQLIESDDWRASPSSFGPKPELSRIVRTGKKTVNDAPACYSEQTES
jgi:putative transposase